MSLDGMKIPTLPSATVLSESAVPKRTPKNVRPEEGAVVNVSVEPETVKSCTSILHHTTNADDELLNICWFYV